MGHQMSEKTSTLVDHVPVLKLPAEKLDASLVALVTAKNGLRKEVTDNVLSLVYPSKWSTRKERSALEKRYMRALVAPALTRLHFARSNPPHFKPAPNGMVMQGANEDFRKSYTSLCVFDFATLTLGLDDLVLPPTGGLREFARSQGPTIVDRVRGLDAILRFYLDFHPERGNGDIATTFRIGHAGDYKKGALDNLLESTFPSGRIIQIDSARSLLMKKMSSMGVLVSSFVVDEWLRASIRSLMLSSFKAPFAAIDSLMEGTKAIGGVMLSTRSQ